MTDQQTIDVLPDAVQFALGSLDGVESRLQDGITVADVGCGLGASTVIMAQAYPRSSFVGSDHHVGSIDVARTRAEDAGVADRVRFESAPAAWFGGGPYDLVTTFSRLSDLGDPVAAAVHVRDQLADDGTWLVVESYAADTISEQAMRRVVIEAGFTQLSRVAETPFDRVYGVRP